MGENLSSYQELNSDDDDDDNDIQSNYYHIYSISSIIYTIIYTDSCIIYYNYIEN